jgi:hypothetical protein
MSASIAFIDPSTAAHPTMSSTTFVECGSHPTSPKKKRMNPG